LIPSIPDTAYRQPAQEVSFYDQVLEKVRALPGVEAAGVIDDLPLNGGGSNQPVAIEGRPLQAMADQPEVSVRLISSGYLKSMHIPVIRGRDFSDQDAPTSPGAVLITVAMAKRLWPNEDPLGKHLTLTFFPGHRWEVVGIVGDVRDRGLNSAPEAMLYMPLAQLSAPKDQPFRSFPVWIVVRTRNHPSTLISAVSNAVHQVNPELPILGTITLDELVGNSLSQQRFNALLFATFAGLALFLAAIGIYSVLAYTVRRRVREIGIRMALGAQIADVLRMIVKEGMKPTLIGLVIGIMGALALGRVLSSLIYGVKATDLATFTAVTIGLVGVGFLASIIPAYRATRIEPVKTLREE